MILFLSIGIKKSWFLPDRVLACRRCPRGSTRLEYLVKWRDLSYQEVTWEYLSVVEHSRALRIFEASECLEVSIYFYFLFYQFF